MSGGALYSTLLGQCERCDHPAQCAAARGRHQNLVDACVAAGVSHVIAQSIAFAYAPGPQPCTEDAPLNLHAEDPVAARTARAALMRGDAGIYNVAEPNGTVSIARAVGLLGWSPAFRERGAG